MKKISVEVTAEFGTVIDYEITDEQYDIYENEDVSLSEILGHNVFEDAMNDYEKYGFNEINIEIIGSENIE